ncbi:ataxin-3-like isoform X2 [Stegodyphus dumicola]|uniref:ataxin-3-like isoform X2 n=1 Tax=Stegodyphus dumicola TaxID=202533 RepID=UPI0015B12A44|nr:ataxin-3-like isoform X2 [Stegodyphus dumicola]
MEEIFHEKQEGSLCAQHCLNALLQAHYFTAVELATLASQIDEEERSRMAEGGLQSEDYRKFLQQPSGNVDDSGYFSVQVIACALKVWGLELIPYNSQCSLAQNARRDPTQQSAYICNFWDHWLTIRKIGYQWFNLNSLLVGPELISDTFLALYLAQLQEEGYSIFIVDGKLPECSADRILRLQPAVQTEKPCLLSEVKGMMNTSLEGEEDRTLRETLKYTLDESLQLEDDCLQAALTLSLNEFQKASTSRNISVRENVNRDNPSDNHPAPSPETEMSEQEMLEAAIKMSMESS